MEERSDVIVEYPSFWWRPLRELRLVPRRTEGSDGRKAVKEGRNERIKEERMDGRMEGSQGRKGGRKEGRTLRKEGRMDGRTEGRMDDRINGRK